MRFGSPRIVVKEADGSGRGPGTLTAIIEDAKNVGISNYVNEPGEMYFTIPLSHPAASSINPLQQHYTVYRYSAAQTWTGGAVAEQFRLVGRGLIDDYEITRNEMVVYGTNYLGFLLTTITGSNTSYTSAQIGTIVTSQITAARAESNSRLAWTSATVDVSNATKTATVLTSFEPRLNFIASLANLQMADSSVRSILSFSNANDQWVYEGDTGDDPGAGKLLLYFGGNVNDYRFWTGRSDFATRIYGIGIKREGAAVLYSQQTYASEATYGRISRPSLHRDVLNQTALDEMVKRDAREAGSVSASVAVQISVDPTDLDPVQVPQQSSGWLENIGLFDRAEVVIRDPFKGVVVHDDYSIMGYEWTVAPNGKEDLYFELTPRRT